MAQIRDGKFATLQTKIIWTALFFLIFMIGRNVPVPYLHNVATSQAQANASLLNAANIASGGNIFFPSVFSLGLGPWMMSAILWRFLFIAKFARDRKIPSETVNRARNAVMVILAFVQAISLMGNYEKGTMGFGPFSDRRNAEILIVIILAAGAIVVAWLAHKNEDLGLGGITMFILYQLMITAYRNRHVLSVAWNTPGYRHVLYLVILACLIVAILGIVAGNAELRLHVNKVTIDSGFTGMSYLPIKLNPAGASPIMYALTLLALPQYLAHAIGAIFSVNVDGFLNHWGLTTPAGYTVYLVLLFVLTIFFGLLSVDPKETAERMKKRGEYFDHVAPGAATRRYLRRYVVRLSAVSGVLMVILSGVPLYFIRTYPNLQYLLLAPGTVMIVLALLWLLQEEVVDTMLGTRYNFTFKGPSKPSLSVRSRRDSSPKAAA